MVALRHPLSGTLYTKIDGGTVEVTGADGVAGLFDDLGRHIAGERRSADAAMCRWVANGISTMERFAAAAQANDTAIDDHREDR